MPFIDSKVTVKISQEKEENIKRKLGQACTSILGKGENWVMIGFEDEYTLYFKGDKCDKAAFVDVRLYGGASSQAYAQMSSEICKIYEEELGIPAASVYVSYQGYGDWGWNGGNL